VVVGSTVVVVVASSAAVVVVSSTVVVVGSRVVVVGSTVLTGAGWGSVVVGTIDAGGLEELGGSVTGAVGRGASVVGGRLTGETGAAAGSGGSEGSAGPAVVDGRSGRVLEGVTEGAGPVVAGAAVVSVGRAPATVGAGGAGGTRAAEATIAARTAKVRPKATSMRRRGSRRWARWRGVRVRMGCCRIVRLWPGLRILRIDRSNGKSRWVIMGGGGQARGGGMAGDGELVAVRADRVVDVEAGEVRAGRVVLVRGERIEAVLDPGRPVPEAAALVDLPGHTLLLGLIDCHTHLVGELQGSGIPAVDRSAAQEALSGVANARATVLAGFTTVRDVGTFRAFVDVALRDAIRDGTVPGPRMAVAGAYVTVPGGGGAVTGLAPDIELPRDLRFGEAASPAEVRQRVRAILYGGADLIKVIATGAVLALGTGPGAPELSPEELAAAVEEAAAHGASVAAHAHGRQGIVNAALAGVRSVEHGSLLDDQAAGLLAERGVYLVADIWNGDYIASEGARQGWPAETLAKNEATTKAQRDGFTRAVKAGVRIAYGTDSGVYPHGWNARQLPYMVRHGMTPMGALQSATVVAAELLGWQDRVGALAPGRYADAIAVPGDPLEDLELLADVPFVMQGGRVLKWAGDRGRAPLSAEAPYFPA
jgi:imidazolonepropionase-like amidohydrolase